MTDLSMGKSLEKGRSGDNAFLAALVAAVLAAIATLGFFMWERANSGGNDAPFLAAVQHK